jgi:hypothetical protein
MLAIKNHVDLGLYNMQKSKITWKIQFEYYRSLNISM